MNQLKVNFGLLRNPSFLAARVGAVTYRFEFWINLMKIKKSLKNQNFDTISHARTQKRGVPEEAKIGRTITRFGFWINLMKIKKSLKNQRRGGHAHTRCQKKRVPEEVKIGRTSTTFDFLTYPLAVWTAASLPYANPEL